MTSGLIDRAARVCGQEFRAGAVEEDRRIKIVLLLTELVIREIEPSFPFACIWTRGPYVN
jgi:hypothetical protein